MVNPSGDCHRVFVYGSLMRGQANHHWLKGATFLGRARLHGGELYDLGAYPMAILRSGSSDVIHGEVFEIDADGLRRLDILEEYPNDYDRRVCPLSDGTQAWVYVGREELVAGCRRVDHGDWASMSVMARALPAPRTSLEPMAGDALPMDQNAIDQHPPN